VVGFSRAIYAAKGWAYHETNGFFWAKIAAFVAVGLLSIIPTIQIIRWRRVLKGDAAFLPAVPVSRRLWRGVGHHSHRAKMPVVRAILG
jgi:putative membrane protein